MLFIYSLLWLSVDSNIFRLSVIEKNISRTFPIQLFILSIRVFLTTTIKIRIRIIN